MIGITSLWLKAENKFCSDIFANCCLKPMGFKFFAVSLISIILKYKSLSSGLVFMSLIRQSTSSVLSSPSTNADILLKS